MEIYYLLLLIVLILLSVSDLIIGIRIDILNSLNTLLTSKSIPSRSVFWAAGLGILLGISISGEMMEVSRNGIFQPDKFPFYEVMIIFITVIVTVIFLRNFFSNINLPLSTTVSVIFSLFGASFLRSIVDIKKSGVTINDLSLYINSDKSLAIMSVILASIAIAFILGFLIQWILRVIFTFRYEKYIHYFGSLFCGFTFSILTLLLLNELKPWLQGDLLSSFQNNVVIIWIISFLGWAILFQILQLVWKKINFLGISIAAATFILAFSFAGNDLANFLGVPMAGLESFKAWKASGISSGADFYMGVLNEPVKSVNFLLFIAGVIVVLSMLNHRKVRPLAFMTDDYSRIDDGSEKKGYLPVSTSIVRGSIMMSGRFNKYISAGIRKWINDRFVLSEGDDLITEVPGADHLRILNILMISSLLVYTGIVFNLPLSTSYIIFMVTLGTSLADRNWNKDTAVYKVSGMISMVGSWFFNAVAAFVLSAVILLLISAGGIFVALIFGIIAFLSVIRSRLFRRKSETVPEDSEEFPELTVRAESVLVKTNQDISNAIIMIAKAYYLGLSSFHSENKEQLREIEVEIEEFNQRMKKLKANIFKVIQKLQQDSIETGHYYVQIIDYLREMAHSIKYVVKPLYEHLENNHKPFSEDLSDELNQFSTQMTDFLNFVLHIIKESRFELIDELILRQQDLLDIMLEQEKSHIRRIRKKETNSRNSVLYFTLMSESKNLLLQTVNLLKATRDFVSSTKSGI